VPWDEQGDADDTLSSTGRLYLDLVEALEKTFPSVIGKMAPEEIQEEVFHATSLPVGIGPLPRRVLDERAKDAARELIVVACKYLDRQRQERLSQAHITFIVAFIALITGIVLAFIAVICIYAASLPVGAATAIAGLVFDIISVSAFSFNKDINNKLDSITRELSIFDRTELAMHYIGYISNTEAKDGAITDLIKRFYTR
jgi:hypothetical protein